MRDLCFASRIGASMVVGVGVHLSFLLVWYYTKKTLDMNSDKLISSTSICWSHTAFGIWFNLLKQR